jgi:hypothetical protein
MDENKAATSTEIGRHLMQVRDRAGLKQGELAIEHRDHHASVLNRK